MPLWASVPTILYYTHIYLCIYPTTAAYTSIWEGSAPTITATHTPTITATPTRPKPLYFLGFHAINELYLSKIPINVPMPRWGILYLLFIGIINNTYSIYLYITSMQYRYNYHRYFSCNVRISWGRGYPRIWVDRCKEGTTHTIGSK